MATETPPDLGRGFSFPGVGSYDSQKGCDFTTGISGQNGSERQQERRTTVQIECPHIIDELPATKAAEDEELGTDHSCVLVVTSARPRTIDHNAGPLSRN